MSDEVRPGLDDEARIGIIDVVGTQLQDLLNHENSVLDGAVQRVLRDMGRHGENFAAHTSSM